MVTHTNSIISNIWVNDLDKIFYHINLFKLSNPKTFPCYNQLFYKLLAALLHFTRMNWRTSLSDGSVLIEITLYDRMSTSYRENNTQIQTQNLVRRSNLPEVHVFIVFVIF